jgi:hypothetical protein
MELGVVLFILAVVLVAATAQAAAGFGFALVAVPLCAAVLDVRDAVVLVSLLGLLSNAILTRTAWRHVPWEVVGPMLAGAFAGMPIGLVVLLVAPQEGLRLAVGAATLVMAAALAVGVRIDRRSVAGEVGAGLVSGLLNTSVGVNGPPIVVYLQGREHAPGEFRGALAVFFFVCNVVTMAGFFATGIVSREALTLWVFALPTVAAGSLLGHMLIRRVEPVMFRRLVFVLLSASAVSAVASSLVRMLG